MIINETTNDKTIVKKHTPGARARSFFSFFPLSFFFHIAMTNKNWTAD